MKRRAWLLLPAIALLLGLLNCGRAAPTPTNTPQPPPTATPVPLPPAPIATPAVLPSDSNLRDLVLYANAIAPLLEQAGQIVQRDGDILKESEGGNDDALCDGRLASDNEVMKGVVESINATVPPSDATAIHELLIKSGEAWTVALDKVDEFCRTKNQLHKVPAVLKFWEAATYLQDAANRFWLLLLSEGVENWVQR